MTRRRTIAALTVAGGAALLYWQVQATGAAEIARGLASVGWTGAALVLLVSLARFLARAEAWIALLPGAPRGRALGAVLAGEAAGALTPFSVFVSEPTKAAYLAGAIGPHGRGIAACAGRMQTAFAALAAETFFFSVSVALYIIIGIAAMLEAFPVDETLARAGLAALGLMTLILAGAAWMAWRRPTIAAAFVARAPFRGADAVAARVRQFEQTIYLTAAHQSARLSRVVLAETTFHVLSFLEAWLTLYLITGESLPIEAFVLDTVGRLTNVIFKIVPLQLGVLQVGSELVAVAIGLPAGTGVTMALVRTARVLCWSVVGVGLLGGWSEIKPGSISGNTTGN